MEEYNDTQCTCYYGRTNSTDTDISTGLDRDTPASTCFYDSQAF